MYSPTGPNPPGMLYQGSQVEHNCCYHTACWIFQILSWISIVASGIIYSKNNDNSAAFVAFGIIYLIYIILEFCSPTSKYLCHKSSDQGIYQKMGIHFQTPPEILFHCECYHYETRTHYTTDSKGHRHRHTERVRVTTYRETYSMPYYSERDVSGLFYLNCDKAYAQQKRYIKLELKEEINFADAISYYDYERAKSAFWRRNRFRDVHFDFNEERRIPGLAHHNLVKLVKQEPCIVNYFWFFFFTILVYQVFVPQINLISQQYQYGQEYYNYLNQGYELELPTLEELEAAKQYQDKVPDYKISSGGGQFQAGVIEDNPGYCSYNPNEAPAEFAAVSGNVALGQDQICANGGPPPDYNKPGFQFNIGPAELPIPAQNDDTGRDLGQYPPNP